MYVSTQYIKYPLRDDAIEEFSLSRSISTLDCPFVILLNLSTINIVDDKSDPTIPIDINVLVEDNKELHGKTMEISTYFSRLA